MTCVKCGTPKPEGVDRPRFCTICGNPVSQICPYEGTNSDTWLPLKDDTGHALSACPVCNQLFKSCADCGRLHKLDEDSCKTPWCDGKLIEPSGTFPCSDGSLCGSRICNWSGPSSSNIKPVAAQDIPRLQKIAYRYGLLIGVSNAMLLTYKWDNNNWRTMGSVPLANTGNDNIRSLMVENGRAFILTDNRTYITSVSPPALEQSISEQGIMQSIANKVWARVISNNQNMSQLIVTDLTTWDSKSVDLDIPPADITCLQIFAKKIIIGAQNNSLLQFDLDDGVLQAFTDDRLRWVRLAAKDNKLLAMGYDDNRRLILITSLANGFIDGTRIFESDVLADFAWSGDNVYVATPSSIMELNIYQLSQNPTIRSNTGVHQTQPGISAIEYSDGNRSIMLHRSSGAISYLFLVDPVSGSQLPVLGAMQGRPLVCIADSRLVLVMHETNNTKLRTLVFEE